MLDSVIEGVYLSKKDIDMGSRIRSEARLYKCDVTYAKTSADMLNHVMTIKYGIIFIGEDCLMYRSFFEDLMTTKFFSNYCMVFIDDSLEKEYKVTKNNVFTVSSNNLIQYMQEIVSRSRLLYYNIINKVNVNKLSKFITKYLKLNGFSQKYVGFQYIKEAIIVAVERNKNVTSFNTEIYPIVAMKNGTQVSNIEKNIRKSIINAYNESGEIFNENKCVKGGFVSNKSFLSYLIDVAKEAIEYEEDAV